MRTLGLITTPLPYVVYFCLIVSPLRENVILIAEYFISVYQVHFRDFLNILTSQTFTEIIHPQFP
jgi:hypothetical protein